MVDLNELQEAAEKLADRGCDVDASVVRAAITFIREHPERDAPGADEAIDELSDTFLRGLMQSAKERKDFARVAANVAEDRYSAGSTAALCTIAILLRHGPRAARDFAADLQHHEG